MELVDSMNGVFESMNRLMDSVNGVFDFMNGLIDSMNGLEHACARRAQCMGMNRASGCCGRSSK
jgi:hypothetical protein